jgi:hypothetical protein
MSRAISVLVDARPELADVFRHVLLPFFLPKQEVAKSCYDLVISELHAAIVEHREQQEEMEDWDGHWHVRDDEAGEDEDDDHDAALWDEVHGEEADMSAVDALNPSWILLCYRAGLLIGHVNEEPRNHLR